MHCDCTVYTTQIKQPWETHLGHRGTNTVTQEFSTSFICCKTSKVHQNQRLTLKGSPKSERTRPRADGESAKQVCRSSEIPNEKVLFTYNLRNRLKQGAKNWTV